MHFNKQEMNATVKFATMIGLTLTFREPILTEQEPFLWGGGAVLEQTGDEEQSPQEQPSETSAHE